MTEIIIAEGAPPMAVVPVPEGIEEFASDTGTYFSTGHAFLGVVHEVAHDLMDTLPESLPETRIVADAFIHMVLSHMLTTVETMNVSIQFALPDSEGNEGSPGL